MNVYTGTHPYYCGIDLHARFMYLCILDCNGEIVYHKNRPCTPESFVQAIAPFQEGLVVGVECIFCWYWLADLCHREGITFILGHALYMKAIHGVKTKKHRIDPLIKDLDAQILRLAKAHDPTSMHLLKSIKGVGDVLALTMLHEIHDIGRFSSRVDFCSYARLVKGQKSSNGKNYGTTGGRIANAHLRLIGGGRGIMNTYPLIPNQWNLVLPLLRDAA